MNGHTPTPGRGSDEQAALWAARLEGSALSEADRSALGAWLGEDPSHAGLLESYQQFSSDVGQLLPRLASQGLLPTAPARRRRSPWLLAAGGLAAAGLALAAILAAWPGPSSESLVTTAGQRRAFTLADGSRVELNANTSLLVENGRSERRVRLANGEAFFVVSKDKDRPFIVDTPAGSVRVTGTIFNVRTQSSSDLDVTVVEGSVQVRAGSSGSLADGPVHLGAGSELTEAPGAGVRVRALGNADVDDAVAWRRGEIVLKGAPLSEALARFAHYHGRLISASPAAASVAVGGRYHLDDLDGFLSDITRSFKVRVTQEPGGAVRVSTADGR